MGRFTDYYRAKGSYSRAGKMKGDKAENREVGTDSVVNHFASMTPGQEAKDTGGMEKGPYPQCEEVGTSADKKPMKVTGPDGKPQIRMVATKKGDAEKQNIQQEKTLTPAEKKKREEIAQAIEKDQPDMPMDKKMAIATAQAKKVAEMKEEEQTTLDEALGTAAKYAGKTGFMGGKYDSNTHAFTSKMGSAYKSKKAAERQRDHEKQDPKMSKGYARNIVDTDKAQRKAKKKGLGKQNITWQQKNSAQDRKLPESVDEAMTPSDKAKRLSAIRKAGQKVNKANAAAAKKAARDAKRGIKKDRDFDYDMNEAKATYCGRCGTTHVPPSQGGKCPALEESFNALAEAMSHAEKVKFQKVGTELKKYGVAKGGVDKGAFQDIGHMFDFRTRTKDGDEPSNQMILNAIFQQDTDVRDKMMDIVTKVLGTKWRNSRPSTKEIFGKFGESVEYTLEEGYEKIGPGVKNMAQRVHNAMKSGEKGRGLDDAHASLVKYHGKDWRKRLGVKEDTQIDEISRDTLSSYKSKASNQAGSMTTDPKTKEKRYSGVARASKKLDQKNREASNPPFTPDPKKKPMKNSDGTTQKPMSRARALAKKAMMKREAFEMQESTEVKTLKSFLED